MQRISDMLGKVIDCYEILEVLGKGGMGVVYKAVDTSLDKLVALKVMNPMLVEDERFLGRFKSEARALGRLQHPHIVSIFALRHVDHHFFIVMEYVEGEALAARIRRGGAMAWQDALPLIEQTLTAIDYAHQEQIIHRDVKPHNILVSREGVAKMTDFGLAKIQADHADTKALTKTGFTGGTLYYMPPEQLEGLLNVDHRGDIYGLGMTYYEMLAGRTPFKKLSSEFAILKAIDAHDFPSLGELNEALPAPLVHIVMKAIEREPDDRFQSAGAMLRALEAWQAGLEPEATRAERAVMPPPEPSEARATPGVWTALKAALTKGTERFSKKPSDSVARTVLKKAPPRSSASAQARAPAGPKAPPKDVPKTPLERTPKAVPADSRPPPSQPPTPTQGEKKDRDAEPLHRGPEAPALAPIAPRTEPSPASAAIPLVQRRLVRVIGGGGALVLLAALLYVGAPRLFPPASGPEEATPTGETVLLSLRTLPDSAMVFIDGQRIGSAPLIDYALGAGTTAVRLEKPGYVALDTSLTLGLNRDATFTFTLSAVLEDALDDQPPAVGALIIHSEPPDAAVELDGRHVGQTPLTVPDLETGSYRLVLRKQGFQTHTRAITIAPGAGNRVTATLTSAVTATVHVTVSPFGDLYIDGVLKAQGSSEPYTEALRAGVYQMRARHPQFGTWDKQVTIDTNDPRDVVFDFNQTFAVAVTSEPDEAEVLVDGRPVGERTPAVVRMRPGQRTIAVRRSGYLMEGAARRITLERDRTDEPLHFPLRQVQ